MNASANKPKASPRRWRTLAKIAVVVLVVAALIPTLQILIPAIAYRDELLALLNYSDDCHAPCFMGITPGKTTDKEAIEILKRHEWVKAIKFPGGGISVTWNDNKSEFTDDGFVTLCPEGDGWIVHSFTLWTNIPFISIFAVTDFIHSPEEDNAIRFVNTNPGKIRFYAYPTVSYPDWQKLAFYNVLDDTLNVDMDVPC